ncbi:MAG: hypothetical protein LBF76_02090 [Holosporales bacterium]|jgi:hypothetical protein|nr:hypothetical protein [Holosporales bacterium]
MHIDRGLRARHIPLFDSSLTEECEDLSPTRSPHLSIGNIGTDLCGVLTEETLWPTKILASARIIPEPIRAQPKLQRVDNRTPCQAVPLYHETAGMDEETRNLARLSRWSAIRLDYAGVMRFWFTRNQDSLFVRGTETDHEKVLFTEGALLYQKPFVTQTKDIQDSYQQTSYGMLPEGSPPEEKRLQLRCYGALWTPYTAPEDIEPVFFQCINLRQLTHIVCTRHSYWKRRGVDVFTGGTVEGRRLYLADTVPEEAKESLATALTKGYAHLTVEKRNGEQRTYQSAHFFKDPHWESAIEVVFVPTA